MMGRMAVGKARFSSTVARATTTTKPATSTTAEPRTTATVMKRVDIPSPVDSMRFAVKKPKNPTLREAMAFSGKGPEMINSRLAMLGFTHAVGFEIATGKTAVDLFWDHPVKIAFFAALFSYATLVPILKSVRDEAFGPFTPEAELLNGRAAMVGMALLLMLEGSTGRAFF